MNEHLLKTSDANVLSSREKKKKTQENLMGGWGASPLARRRVTFPGGEFYWIWIDIFKCAPRWKEKRS